MHGAKRGKIWRWYQRITYRNLSGKYKSILQLRHKCHHSWANISVRMGAPDSTVRSWHDKAVLCLGEALDEVPMAEELLERASRARTY